MFREIQKTYFRSRWIQGEEEERAGKKESSFLLSTINKRKRF